MEQLYVRQGVPTNVWLTKGLFSSSRLNRVIYGMLLQQQTTMDKIETGELLGQQNFQMAVINQSDDKSPPTVLQARLDELEEWPSKDAPKKPPDPPKTAETISRCSKYLPSIARFDRWGFSAHLVAFPGPKNRTYRAAIDMSPLGKMYSVQLLLRLSASPSRLIARC